MPPYPLILYLWGKNSILQEIQASHIVWRPQDLLPSAEIFEEQCKSVFSDPNNVDPDHTIMEIDTYATPGTLRAPVVDDLGSIVAVMSETTNFTHLAFFLPTQTAFIPTKKLK